MDLGANIRCAIIAVIGRANVGKSSLINRMVEEKVSIVSPVAQTTRNVIRAIHTEERGQLVFLDTPGIHKPMSDLGKSMNQVARSANQGVDISMLVLDTAEPPQDEDTGWMRRLLFEKTELIFVLNKTDIPKSNPNAYREAWDEIQREKEKNLDVTWIETSAKTGRGLEPLLETLFASAPMGPMLFPEDIVTDFPKKLIMADIIREQFFAVLHDEIPHHLAVRVTAIDDTTEPWRITATVFVHRATQKGIVLGHKGRLIRQVKQKAAEEISQAYEHEVEIEELWVKVEKNWMTNFFMLKQLGYKD